MERALVKRGLNRIILLPVVLSALYALVLIWQLQRMLGEGSWVEHTTHVIALTSDVQKHISAQESSLRGYLLTRSPLYASQFSNEDAAVDTTFQQLHQATLDNKTQTERLDSIIQLYWAWQASARHRMASAAGPTDSAIYVRTGFMQRMRGAFDRFSQEEQTLYDGRVASFKSGTSLLTGSIAALSILLGLILGTSARRQTQVFVRKFTETLDAATASQELLHTTLLSIGDAIIVTDSTRRVTLMNARAEELTGWVLEEAKHHVIDEVFHIVDETTRHETENPIHQVLREGRIVELTNHTLLISRQGLEYPIDDSAAPIRNSRRELVGAVLVFRDITNRKESEQESQQREREFRALIENAPDVIIRYNTDLVITYVNPAIESMLGISPTAMIGRRFKDVGIPEELYGPWERAVREVFQVQRNISTEIEYQTLHGFRRYQARLVPEVDNKGVQSVISIARDITDIKKTEERLRESEQRFRGVVENSPDAFFLLRATRNGKREITDFTFDYLNARGASLITVPAEQLVGKKLRETMPSARVDHFFERYKNVIETQVPLVEEYRVATPYLHHAQWLRSQYVPIGDSLAITTIDITEAKRTELSLRASEERYRRLVDNASEPIFSTDRTGKLTYANPYIRELSGYSEDEVPNFYFSDLVTEEYRSKVKRHFYRQFLSRAPYSYIEAPFITKSGDERWLAVTTSLLVRDEKVEGFDCVATDITDQKQEQSRLIEAKTRAEEDARASMTRLEQLTRDLKLPVNSILSMSDLLSHGKFPTDLQETASRIALNAQRIRAALDNARSAQD